MRSDLVNTTQEPLSDGQIQV